MKCIRRRMLLSIRSRLNDRFHMLLLRYWKNNLWNKKLICIRLRSLGCSLYCRKDSYCLTGLNRLGRYYDNFYRCCLNYLYNKDLDSWFYIHFGEDNKCLSMMCIRLCLGLNRIHTLYSNLNIRLLGGLFLFFRWDNLFGNWNCLRNNRIYIFSNLKLNFNIIRI